MTERRNSPASMRAIAVTLVVVFAALAQLAAGAASVAIVCDGDGTCCCAAHAPDDVGHDAVEPHGCCAPTEDEAPRPEPKRGCDCHVDRSPPAPPEAPLELPSPMTMPVPLDAPTPMRFGEPAPRAFRTLGVCRPPGPPGDSRQVALCVFLI